MHRDVKIVSFLDFKNILILSHTFEKYPHFPRFATGFFLEKDKLGNSLSKT